MKWKAAYAVATQSPYSTRRGQSVAFIAHREHPKRRLSPPFIPREAPSQIPIVPRRLGVIETIVIYSRAMARFWEVLRRVRRS